MNQPICYEESSVSSAQYTAGALPSAAAALGVGFQEYSIPENNNNG
jgi:hypothetical protein